MPQDWVKIDYTGRLNINYVVPGYASNSAAITSTMGTAFAIDNIVDDNYDERPISGRECRKADETEIDGISVGDLVYVHSAEDNFTPMGPYVLKAFWYDDADVIGYTIEGVEWPRVLWSDSYQITE